MIPVPHPNAVSFKLTVHKDSSADSSRTVPDWNCPNTEERTLFPVHTVLCPVVSLPIYDVSLSHPCRLSVPSVLFLSPVRVVPHGHRCNNLPLGST